MRISQDDSSWHADGIKRRDFRSDPQAPYDEERRLNLKGSKRRKKKEELLWCKGKEGRQHDFPGKTPRYSWRTNCKRCGVSEYKHNRALTAKISKETNKLKVDKVRSCDHNWQIQDPLNLARMRMNLRYSFLYHEYYHKEPDVVYPQCVDCGKVDKLSPVNVEDIWKYKKTED